ncbi:MAG: glycoside hydrolase family 38 C-terminal domain-containing protein [Candidatus Kryptonium sp.]|nr:glycoside hydrolase family 38 C-terminal domain-containing protein [Candidatus Kryptonium sp.]
MLKKLTILFIILSTSIISQTKSKVDSVTSILDSLSTISIRTWKVSPDIKCLSTLKTNEPTKVEYDDSKWDTLKLGQRVYIDSCWIRSKFKIPEKFLGKAISGKIVFKVSVDDYGYLWVNEKYVGYIPWDGEFDLTSEIKPGQEITFAIKAVNTGGPLRLLRAEFEIESVKEIVNEIKNLSLSLKVAQKLLSFDTYQTNDMTRHDPKIDKSTIKREERIKLNNLLQSSSAEIDLSSLSKGDFEKFAFSVEKIKKKLTPIREFSKRFTLIFVSNAHIDAAWLWRVKETIEVCKNTFNSVINLMRKYPHLTYTQSSAVYYEWMRTLYPDLFSEIKNQIKLGKWEVVGGTWIEPDCNLPGGESWMHNLLYSQRYFQKVLGVKPEIGWIPDSFGYTWTLPTFFAKADITAFVTQKLNWNERNVFPYRLFWWESPDGSRVLTYFPFSYVNTIENPFRLIDWLRQFEANTGFRELLILFGVGDHGGGPTEEMLKRIEELKKLYIFPEIKFSTVSDYFKTLQIKDLKNLPVWRDELYLEYHQGTYTTHSDVKKYNRKLETALSNAEKFSAIATLFDFNYDNQLFEKYWLKFIFNQFHDILPGSSIREVYFDAKKDYEEVENFTNFQIRSSLEKVAQNINTNEIKDGEPIIIFNPSSWERTDIVKLEMKPFDENEYTIFDLSGKEIASQNIIEEGRRKIIFIAENVPPIGYKTYILKKQKPTKFETELKITKSTIENRFFKVEIDTTNGWISGIFDKRYDKQILTAPGNKLQLLEDKPSAWDAWNVGLTGIEFHSAFRGCEVVESGPVRSVLKINRDFRKPDTRSYPPTETFPTSFFTQYVILYDKIERIDFRVDVDWWEKNIMFKVAFPLSVKDTVATYEIPYGYIQRSTQMRNSWDSAKVEVPALRWADISEKNYGVSLINGSKYGYDCKGSVMRLSLLRSPNWPDPTADRGFHTIEYALYPHKGTWKEAKTTNIAYDFNNPLIPILTDKHSGSLPVLNYSFVKLAPENLILTVLKKSEDANAWTLQFYESQGKDTEGEIVLPFVPSKVFISNFIEEDKSELKFSKEKITLKVKPHSIVTLKIYR